MAHMILGVLTSTSEPVCLVSWLVFLLFCFSSVFASIKNTVYKWLLLFLFKFPFSVKCSSAQLMVWEIFLSGQNVSLHLDQESSGLGILSPLEANPLAT